MYVITITRKTERKAKSKEWTRVRSQYADEKARREAGEFGWNQPNRDKDPDPEMGYVEGETQRTDTEEVFRLELESLHVVGAIRALLDVADSQ